MITRKHSEADACMQNVEGADMILVVAGIKPFISVLQKAGPEKTHRQGCVIVDEFGRTNIEGVFAAGGCASTVKDIIPACMGDGTVIATCTRLCLAYGARLASKCNAVHKDPKT